MRPFQSLSQDVRYGCRMLAKSPVFTIVVVLSLAIGIGANALLFGVIDAAYLRKVAIHEPDQLQLLRWQMKGGPRVGGAAFSSATFEALDPHTVFAFSDLLAGNTTSDGQAVPALLQFVSGGYFPALAVRPESGRFLNAEDDRGQAAPVVVVSHRYWKRQLGSDPAAVGRQLTVNGVGVTIVGIMPEQFRGTETVQAPADFFVPLGLAAEMRLQPSRSSPKWLHIMARLNPGVTADQFRGQLEGVFSGIFSNEPHYRESAGPFPGTPGILVVPGNRGLAGGSVSAMVSILVVVSIFLLLVVCLNVANLLVARAGARRNEMAIRLSIGAPRSRLVRQMLIEGIMLAVLGGSLSLVLVVAGAPVSRWIMRSDVAVDVDLSLATFTAALTLLCPVLFALLPALHGSRLDLSVLTSRDGGNLAQLRSRFSQSALVLQAAFSVVLLLAAGLFIRTVANGRTADVGFDKQNLLLFEIRPGDLGYDANRRRVLYEELSTLVRTIPGVREVTSSTFPLGVSRGPNLPLRLPTDNSIQAPRVLWVAPNFFSAMGIPLIRGGNHETESSARETAVVSRGFVRFFRGVDPIGLRLNIGGDSPHPDVEIVGIAENAMANSLLSLDPSPVFLSTLHTTPPAITFAVRTTGDPLSFAPPIRKLIMGIDSDLAMHEIKTQEQLIGEGLAETRVLLVAAGVLGLVSLALGCIGIYGLTAYAVSRRAKEIAIRLALGGTRTRIIVPIIYEHLKFVFVGLLCGVGMFVLGDRTIRKFIYGVGVFDPVTVASVAIVLTAVGFAAAYVPSSRASKVEPSTLLRND